MQVKIVRKKLYVCTFILIIFILLYCTIKNDNEDLEYGKKSMNSLDASQIQYEKQIMERLHGSALGKMPSRKKKINEKYGISSRILDTVSKAIYGSSFNKHVIVHVDLKGAPPKIPYLIDFLSLIKSFGATGVLVEYEDMFPYSGRLKNISAMNAYSREDIEKFYNKALELGLEFIPLVQTFGHMEHLLKLKEFSDLREVPAYPQAICPTNNKTNPIIRLMLDQVIKMHPGLNWIHIGSDEVYNIGDCNRCQDIIIKNSWSKDDLFLDHVLHLAKYVKTSYDVMPIMWDDELRKIPQEMLKASHIGQYVEIMVWYYSPGILSQISSDVWDKYHNIFDGIWMASAFKGASKPDSFISDISDRLNNNKEWMDVYKLYENSLPFRGITLTGWQRYDHFAVPCELLPQAVPSLAIILTYIRTKKSDHETILKIGERLGCDSFLNIDPNFMEYVNDCNYPGSDILKLSQRLYLLKNDLETMLQDNLVKGWLNPYNIKHNFASPKQIELGLQNLSMLLFECKKLLSESKSALSKVFDEYTIEEWMSIYVYPVHKQLIDLNEARKNLLSKTHWPRRPLVELLNNEL